MLTQGEDVEAHALRQRGWSISAIARHVDRDRKTVRAYLNGDRHPGVRASSTPGPLARFEPYLRARFADDCHLWATSLFDEVVPLGYDRSYPTFARQLRERQLRPHCEACRGVLGRDTIEIEHPPGEEIFDDPTVAAAMLDRLLRSVVFNITGESYRMRTHRAHADKLRRATTQVTEA